MSAADIFILLGTGAIAGFAGGMLGLYLMGYGIVRFGLEFFREPDPHLMFVLGPFTMGQVLCGTMVLIGLAAFVIGRRAARRVETF